MIDNITAKDIKTLIVNCILTTFYVILFTTQVLAQPAAISSVYATQSDGTAANGTYGTGEDLRIIVEFTSTVTLAGKPELTFETGDVDRTSNNSWLGGSGLAIVFQYIVRDGDVSDDLDYISPLALALNGATITDTDGNPANLILPAPGTRGSLSYNNDIAISTRP